MSDLSRRIKAPGIRSICWAGETLIDWVAGGRVLHPDGTVQYATVNYAYRFDAVVNSACGKFAVIYEKLGTKGLVLAQGEVLREINRSFYHAHDYEYPICIFQTRSGRVLMVHCPDEYNRLEIEDIETGERLTSSKKRQPADFFHSRLRVSRDGRWLLSAGWVWHPWNDVAIFDIDAALQEPETLDRSMHRPDIAGEVTAAEFLHDNRVLISTFEENSSDQDIEAGGVGVNALAVLAPSTFAVLSYVTVNEPTGTLMPIGDNHVIGFYEHPKLLSHKTGDVLKRWDSIYSGNQMSSMIWAGISVPPIACDPLNRRFAVADEEFVSIITDVL